MSYSLLPTLLSYGVPVLTAVLVSVLSVIALGLFLANTRIAALLFFVVILCSVDPTYGFRETVEFSPYTKGSRTFFFPIIQLYLYGLFLATLFGNGFAARAPLKGAGEGWMLAFATLFTCHVAYGLAIGVSLALLLSPGGLINVLHMSMIAYVAVSAIRDEKSIALLVKTLLGVAVLRGCYGLARFLFLGGDPQNAYANLSGLALRITFWDFNEGLIASLVVFYCARRLFCGWRTLSLETRAFFVGAIVVELLVLLFSYRRTNWYGLLLAGSYFVWMLPKGKRAVTALIFVLLMLPPVVYLSTQRQQASLRQSNLSLIERIAPDIVGKGSITARDSRFFELYTAFDSVKRSPLVGVGAWGEFDVGTSSAGLEYHRGYYGFVHSGFGHVLLKSGLIGLVIFCGILFSTWRFASRARSRVPEKDRALFESCMAGLIFLLPAMLFGGPIVVFRSMALLGVLLAVPIAISRVATLQEPQPLGASRLTMARAMRPFILR